MSSKNTIGTVISLVLLIAVFVILYRHSSVIAEVLKQAGPWAPVVAILLYILLAPTPIAADPITIVMGVTYGPLVGIIIGSVGSTLSAIVEYYMGVSIGKRTNFEAEKDKLPFGLGRMPVDTIPFLLIGRMIPGYGSKAFSLLAGGYHVPLKRYIWTSALTSIGGSMILTLGVSGILNLFKSIPLPMIRP